jgi:hypothetical protein
MLMVILIVSGRYFMRSAVFEYSEGDGVASVD